MLINLPWPNADMLMCSNNFSNCSCIVVYINFALTCMRWEPVNSSGFEVSISEWKKLAEWQAETYEHHSSEQREDALRPLELIRLEKDVKLLDIGCGTGYVTKCIADKVGPGGKV